MSIIYDALEKTQQNRGKHSEQPPLQQPKKPRFKLNKKYLKMAGLWTLVLMSAAMLGIGAPRMVVFFATTKIHFAQKKPVQMPVPPKPQPVLVEAKFRSSHHLKGVFLSPRERLAIINETIFHEGDVVDGMLVTAINQQGVTLKNANEIFVLSSPV